MKSMLRSALVLGLLVCTIMSTWWVSNYQRSTPLQDKSSPTAKVANVVKEDELNTIVLSTEAERRIGITVATIATKNIRPTRTYGGEVTLPLGQSMSVAAPFGGTLKATARGLPKVGSTVKSGQTLMQLALLLTPDSRATLTASLTEADGQVMNATAQVENTRIALDRAKRVLKEGAGSQRQVDDAQASYDVATKALEAAKARYAILLKVSGGGDQGTTTTINIDAPQDGVLRSMTALPGQSVPSGALLFEVINLQTLWVRVPLPVGDWDELDRNAPGHLAKLTATATTPSVLVQPVSAPPSANPLAASMDLYYALPNDQGAFIPGQRVSVRVPQSIEQSSRVVPWSAIVVDINGGTWVYEQMAPRQYIRKRVSVRYTIDQDAVLSNGPNAGTKIVTAGVLELFGAETGFVK